MKNQEFISREYPRACRYCERGRFSFDETAILCPVQGIVPPDDCCRKYIYDPLKRTPMTGSVNRPEFKPEDFAL